MMVCRTQGMWVTCLSSELDPPQRSALVCVACAVEMGGREMFCLYVSS